MQLQLHPLDCHTQTCASGRIADVGFYIVPHLSYVLAGQVNTGYVRKYHEQQQVLKHTVVESLSSHVTVQLRAQKSRRSQRCGYAAGTPRCMARVRPLGQISQTLAAAAGGELQLPGNE